jgi:hypothetical protein
MEEIDLISEIESHQENLRKDLVNGGNDLSSDNKIRGMIIGLELAKGIIHESFVRLNNGENEPKGEF